MLTVTPRHTSGDLRARCCYLYSIELPDFICRKLSEDSPEIPETPAVALEGVRCKADNPSQSGDTLWSTETDKVR